MTNFECYVSNTYTLHLQAAQASNLKRQQAELDNSEKHNFWSTKPDNDSEKTVSDDEDDDDDFDADAAQLGFGSPDPPPVPPKGDIHT